MFKRLRSEPGQILIFAMVFMAILLVMSTSIVGYMVIHTKAERAAIANKQAQQLAEAGIDKAIYELNENQSYSGEANTTLGSGTFTTSITTVDSNTKRITATGNVTYSGGLVATKIVKATANVDYTTVSFSSAVQVGVGGLTMANGSTINGNVFSNGNISGSGSVTGDAVVAAGTAATADKSWTTQNADFLFGNSSSRTAVAQSFMPSATNTINKIQVYIKKVGSPGDLTVQIVSDDSGAPSKTVLTTGSVAAARITTSYGFIDGTFSSNPTLNGGQKYWLMLVAPVSASNYYSVGLDSTDGFANNTAKYSDQWNAGRPTWTNCNGDFDFKTYMGGVITSLSGLSIGGNARAMQLDSCSITGNAYFELTNSCSVGGSEHPGTVAAAPQAMPISNAQIAEWEETAEAGGVISGNYSIAGGSTVFLGPKKIDGDFIMNNNSTLYLKGPVWVKGNITLSNNDFVYVDASLGNSGTVLLADYSASTSLKGQIVVPNGVTIAGNGNPGSYPLLISTYSGTGDALSVANQTSGTVYFAANGNITLSNNAVANELTGYSIHVNNNATINYNSGLQDANFSNGPGGSWVYKPGTYVLTK